MHKILGKMSFQRFADDDYGMYSLAGIFGELRVS
jgi:hypothetical protein